MTLLVLFYILQTVHSVFFTIIHREGKIFLRLNKLELRAVGLPGPLDREVSHYDFVQHEQ